MSDDVKVKVSHMTKKFGDLLVLNDISFDVKKGEFLCVVGPTGCGKTTFLNCLTKLKAYELTGGDAITARFLRCEAFTFLPMFKIVMSSNFLPTVTNATDKGIKRRLIIVPFSAELDNIRDVTLKERLLYPQERSGILAWCVDGCLKWQREGLGEMPIAIKKMLSDYYAENDVIGEFISTYCNIGEDLRVKAKDLYKAFTEEMGYGIGWHFLGRLELMPYALVGAQLAGLTKSNMQYWDFKEEDWANFPGGMAGLTPFFTGHAGLRLNVNLWYPVQLTVGADYNCNIPLDKKKEVSYKNHELNRLNFYAGLRFNL